MLPSSRFLGLPVSFWSYVRSISEWVGYSKAGAVLKYDQKQAIFKLKNNGIDTEELETSGSGNHLLQVLEEYFAFRADLLTTKVRSNLMNGAEAKELFDSYRSQHPLLKAPLPMNKQKLEMSHVNYLTGLVNIVTEASLGGYHFNGSPGTLAVMLKDKKPVTTMSRRLDGAYPTTVNPIAVWEVKEYYDNKSFGSRIADGVYETLLDGYELRNLYQETGIKVWHYLILDSFNTWWKLGIPYLCRLVDAMHMGLVDEVVVGKEVVTRWPEIVHSWLPGK